MTRNALAFTARIVRRFPQTVFIVGFFLTIATAGLGFPVMMLPLMIGDE